MVNKWFRFEEVAHTKIPTSVFACSLSIPCKYPRRGLKPIDPISYLNLAQTPNVTNCTVLRGGEEKEFDNFLKRKKKKKKEEKDRPISRPILVVRTSRTEAPRLDRAFERGRDSRSIFSMAANCHNSLPTS